MTDDLQTASPVPVPVDDVPVPVEASPSCPGTLPTTAHDPAAQDPAGQDPVDWSWPPYAPLEPAGGRRFACDDWAPSSIVRRPLLRVGRWTLLYRRGS